MIEWILARLKEKSTWAGLATVVASSGLAWLSPDLFAAIGTLVVSLIGVYEVVRKEKDAD